MADYTIHESKNLGKIKFFFLSLSGLNKSSEELANNRHLVSIRVKEFLRKDQDVLEQKLLSLGYKILKYKGDQNGVIFHLESTFLLSDHQIQDCMISMIVVNE